VVWALSLSTVKLISHSLTPRQHIYGIRSLIGSALSEGLKFNAEGKLLNPTFTDYKIPTAKDMPDEIVPILIENPQADGPFGARGVGEHPMISIPSAIGNALYDALGINFYKLPLNPENIALEIAGTQAP
jgi:CO/xanthine dehydrogenase Mo-binding subunit